MLPRSRDAAADQLGGQDRQMAKTGLGLVQLLHHVCRRAKAFSGVLRDAISVPQD